MTRHNYRRNDAADLKWLRFWRACNRVLAGVLWAEGIVAVAILATK